MFGSIHLSLGRVYLKFNFWTQDVRLHEAFLTKHSQHGGNIYPSATMILIFLKLLFFFVLGVIIIVITDSHWFPTLLTPICGSIQG